MKKFLLVFLVALAAAGCKREVVIQDAVDQPVARYDGRELSLDQIEQAIVVAGAERGWTMQSVKPGHLIGVLDVRNGKHRAVVDIHYDTRTYSIRYKDSENLLYQPPNRIHRRYNGWVANLARSINTNIQRVQ